MKYYLETNALRAIGKNIGKNPELTSISYTSSFSLFELAKGINRKSDSVKRFNILSHLLKTNLMLVNRMPYEMMELAFNESSPGAQSTAVIEKISSLFSQEELDNSYYEVLVSEFEKGTLAFQEKIRQLYVKPKPEPEEIHLDIDTMFAEPNKEPPKYIQNLPPNLSPSRILMEVEKQEAAPLLYKLIYPESKISETEILTLYNNNLDVFMFAKYGYTLKKSCLREAASKNDLLDILHAVYLFDHDQVMVSSDDIFEYILPNTNHISTEEYKKLI